jgi:hypothetical protein
MIACTSIQNLPNPKTNLQRRVRVPNQVDEVLLEPLASLRCRLVRIRKTARRVVAGSRGVGGTVRLASRLDPDNGINEVRASVSRRAGTEASTLNVAPVAPLVTDVLDTRATLVDDEVGREALAAECGRELLDEVDLIVVRVRARGWVG